MATLSVRHAVEDFEKFSAVFAENKGLRQRHGATGHRVLRDGNDVVVLVEFPDEAAARGLVTDPALRTAMQNAGTSGAEITILTEVEQTTY
jgi:uncharacterized protein (DUF1330 family)